MSRKNAENSAVCEIKEIRPATVVDLGTVAALETDSEILARLEGIEPEAVAYEVGCLEDVEQLRRLAEMAQYDGVKELLVKRLAMLTEPLPVEVASEDLC